MHLNAKKPVLMPPDQWREFEKLSKAALMDLAWDFAEGTIGEGQPEEKIAAYLRERAATVNFHRSRTP